MSVGRDFSHFLRNVKKDTWPNRLDKSQPQGQAKKDTDSKWVHFPCTDPKTAPTRKGMRSQEDNRRMGWKSFFITANPLPHPCPNTLVDANLQAWDCSHILLLYWMEEMRETRGWIQNEYLKVWILNDWQFLQTFASAHIQHQQEKATHLLFLSVEEQRVLLYTFGSLPIK